LVATIIRIASTRSDVPDQLKAAMIETTGIGGLFFRAQDPTALAEWYQTHLGVASDFSWTQQAGATVFAPFPESTDYFPSDRRWMINFRVVSMDAALEHLTSNAITFETRAEWDNIGMGRFARLYDPEGNPIELWEPPAEDE
jgi:predicted enzyme related to lactoylglutathione lyase